MSLVSTDGRVLAPAIGTTAEHLTRRRLNEHRRGRVDLLLQLVDVLVLLHLLLYVTSLLFISY